jgi:hypothetical protein
MTLRPTFRAMAPLLILLALAARLLVPAGFMPATGADGITRLVICSGMGPIDVPARHDANAVRHATAMHHGGEDKPSHHQDGQGDHACPFAAVAHALNLGDAIAAAISYPVTVAAGAALILFVRPGLGLAAPPPPKTGPPARG